MNELMNKYFGITVPMLYYKNHEPIEYWYDSDKNVLHAECGVEVPINLSERDYTKSELRKLIQKLDRAVIEFYCQNNHLHLLHNDD